MYVYICPYTYIHIYIYIYTYVDTHPHTHTRLLGIWLPSKDPGFTATSLCPARISQISVLMSENLGITGLSRRDLARAYYGPSVYQSNQSIKPMRPGPDKQPKVRYPPRFTGSPVPSSLILSSSGPTLGFRVEGQTQPCRHPVAS